MSDETFGIMRGLDMRMLETQVALQCAPLLTGIKISNLLNVGADKKNEAAALFCGTAVSSRVLYEQEGRISMLLYRKEQLEAYLDREGPRLLLEELGCGRMSLDALLNRVAEEYQCHMEGRGGFPHEIGLLLGYPAKDVKSFVEKEGRGFLCSGYWKVYGNLTGALRMFKAYDRAREAVIHMAGSGAGIRDILAACHPGRIR